MRALVIILCLLLTGCGQKGPLYPPESPARLSEFSA
ncbi:MAG: lipoprotein [Candidatus Azotimanducaceae bacterium]